LSSCDQPGFSIFPLAAGDIDGAPLKPKRLQNPAQVGSRAAEFIEVNLIAPRHPAFHLLKLAFKRSRTLAQGELRLG
jgi:hypothetical protein